MPDSSRRRSLALREQLPAVGAGLAAFGVAYYVARILLRRRRDRDGAGTSLVPVSPDGEPRIGPRAGRPLIAIGGD